MGYFTDPYKWAMNWGEITHWSDHHWNPNFRPGTSKYLRIWKSLIFRMHPWSLTWFTWKYYTSQEKKIQLLETIHFPGSMLNFHILYIRKLRSNSHYYRIMRGIFVLPRGPELNFHLASSGILGGGSIPMCMYIYIYHGPPKPTCLEVYMVNNLVFRWSKPLFFMVLGAHGIYVIRSARP